MQTKIPLEPQQYNQIHYDSKILLVGSCFAESIGEKLNYFKLQSTINPFGILFHPIAIEKLITNAINDKEYSKEDVFIHNEQWHNFDAHSNLCATSIEDTLEQLNKSRENAKVQICSATHIIITLGTAWVYRHIETDTIVANCHKLAQKKFLKKLLSVEDINESLQSILALIKQVNRKATVVFTVSPVRHTKDGFVENNLSKAHLISGIHQVIDKRNGVLYFPSYEIMMDELRDYRFYSEDMIHPNKIAIDYIWERFKRVWISETSYQTMDDVDSIQKGMSHQPFNSKTDLHKQFLEKLQKRKFKLKTQFPHIVF